MEQCSVGPIYRYCLQIWLLVTSLNVLSGLGKDANPPLDPNLTPVKLYGPDDAGMLECVVPSSYPVDTYVEWYINGDNLKRQMLPRGLNHVYESMDDVIDLLGNYPATAQCKLADKAVTETALESNVILWV